MGGGVVGLDEGLMPLFEVHRRAGLGELIVIDAALDVKVRLHPVQVTLALAADDRLMLDLQPPTHGLKVRRPIGPPLSETR
jgi:hypothetical protein